jgi:hypothetical protein
MELNEYIEIEKVTKNDLLIFKVKADSDVEMVNLIEEIIMGSKSILDDLGIKTLFIPEVYDVDVEISKDWPEEELIELYNTQQYSLGKKDGFMKALGDIDTESEYNDEILHRNENYISGYKEGYYIGWEVYE